jgi:drug/metabolite transporter (DMT)-like permease
MKTGNVRNAIPPEAAPVVVVAVYAVLVVLWGTTWLAIKVGLDYVPPFFSLAVRFIVAGLVVLLIMKLFRENIPWQLEHQPFFAMLGLLSFVISYGVVYWAEQYITSGLAAVLFGMFPLFTGIIAHFLLGKREPLGVLRLAGLLVGLAGVVAIKSGDLKQVHPLAPMAALLVLLSPLSSAFASVMSKRRMEEFSPFAFAGLPMLYGGLVHIVLWRLLEADRPIVWSWQGFAATAYLTLFGSVATFLGYFWLLQRMEVNRANLIAYLTPLVALAVGFLIADETVTPQIVVGTILILGGVAVANRSRARP